MRSVAAGLVHPLQLLLATRHLLLLAAGQMLQRVAARLIPQSLHAAHTHTHTHTRLSARAARRAAYMYQSRDSTSTW
eukprot:960433-Pyramimonas_sp.AAC.2